MSQALSYLTPSWRESSRLEIEFFDCVMKNIAWNHFTSGRSDLAKMVPALSEV